MPAKIILRLIDILILTALVEYGSFHTLQMFIMIKDTFFIAF